MAKVKIQGHASGTGVLTVTAPNTSTDRTITLPDATGTLLTADGDGSNLTGVSSVGGATGVDFNDNVKARFGTSDDLEIYHDGSNSIIHDNGTGNLLLKGDNLSLRSSGNESYVTGVANGAVSIYHDNSVKLETTSTGVSVTGAIAGATNLGKLLQVKHVSSTGAMSATSTTETIATITMTKISSTSKLLIKGFAYLGMKSSGANTDGANPYLRLKNGSTEIVMFYHSDVPDWYSSGNYNGTYDTHYKAAETLYTAGAGSITINLTLTATGDGVWVNRSIGNSSGGGSTGLTIMEIEV